MVNNLVLGGQHFDFSMGFWGLMGDFSIFEMVTWTAGKADGSF